MDTVNICCINNKIYQTIEYTTIIDLNEKLKYIIDNNCELCIQLTLNNIVLNKFNIINNAVLSKLTDTDVIKIIFNQEDLLLDCTTNNLKILEAVKNNINVLLDISDDLKNDNINSNNNIINNDLKYIEKLSIPRLQCGYCEKFYKSIKTKSFHMKSCKLIHPEIIIVNNKDICCYCNKKFNCIRTMYYHKKICDKKREPLTTINNNSNNNITNNNINNTTNNNSNNITNNNTIIINNTNS